MKNLAALALPAALAAAFALPGASLAADACPAEQAVYELSADGDTYRVSLIPSRNIATIASDLYLKLTTPQRDYWFTFSVSNGYSGMTLLPVSDPYAEDAAEDGPRGLLSEPWGDNAQEETPDYILASLRFYSLDEDLVFQFEPPMAGDDAPPYLMMPEIGLTLWYDAAFLTEDPSAGRDPMPRGIFQVVDCLAEPPPPAYP